MTDLQLFQLLRPIILTVTGVPECILGDPNEGAPSGPYAAVRPSQSIDQRGQANVSRANVGPVSSPIGSVFDVETTIKAQIIAQCSINFYRTGAMQFARSLMQCNKRPDVSASLFLAGVGWNRSGPVNNLTTLISGRQEERSQISIYLMYETSDPVTINAIYSVSVVVENEDGDLLTEIEV